MLNAKEMLRVFGCFDRATELLLFIGSLNYINAEDRSVNGQHLLVLPAEVR